MLTRCLKKNIHHVNALKNGEQLAGLSQRTSLVWLASLFFPKCNISFAVCFQA